MAGLGEDIMMLDGLRAGSSSRALNSDPRALARAHARQSTAARELRDRRMVAASDLGKTEALAARERQRSGQVSPGTALRGRALAAEILDLAKRQAQLEVLGENTAAQHDAAVLYAAALRQGDGPSAEILRGAHDALAQNAQRLSARGPRTLSGLMGLGAELLTVRERTAGSTAPATTTTGYPAWVDGHPIVLVKDVVVRGLLTGDTLAKFTAATTGVSTVTCPLSPMGLPQCPAGVVTDASAYQVKTGVAPFVQGLPGGLAVYYNAGTHDLVLKQGGLDFLPAVISATVAVASAAGSLVGDVCAITNNSLVKAAADKVTTAGAGATIGTACGISNAANAPPPPPLPTAKPLSTGLKIAVAVGIPAVILLLTRL